jgi:hypothetical protein
MRDLHRSFVTLARRSGLPESVVARFSGHRTENVIKRYKWSRREPEPVDLIVTSAGGSQRTRGGRRARTAGGEDRRQHLLARATMKWPGRQGQTSTTCPRRFDAACTRYSQRQAQQTASCLAVSIVYSRSGGADVDVRWRPQSVTRDHRPARDATVEPLRPARGHRLWTAAVRIFLSPSSYAPCVRDLRLEAACISTLAVVVASGVQGLGRVAPRLGW